MTLFRTMVTDNIVWKNSQPGYIALWIGTLPHICQLPRWVSLGPDSQRQHQHGRKQVLDDLTGDAAICLAIRDLLGIMVMDVDYRLSPSRESFPLHPLALKLE